MGLGGLKTTWQRQTKDFGHTRASTYSVLIYDNRGMGASSKPMGRYSTSEMAQDAVELLDHIGWTSPRSVHALGISMGGMIAQELGLIIPNRLASLSLISTAARIKNTVGYFENLWNRFSMFIPKSPDASLAMAKRNMFTDKWLLEPDVLATESVEKPFPSNGDRIGASELQKRMDTVLFPRHGLICQAIAAGWHHKTDADLMRLGEAVGLERILVIHGTQDRMITFPHVGVLLNGLRGERAETTGPGGCIYHEVKDMGHVVPIEIRDTFKEWVEELVEKVEKL
ncbi:alpha/beta-hydrolase [Aulographum hederae CBS 113979]|uniref:Alpha/beta-hydrolase n=1 Tax=Aulographum hederae CBS 113979 TaxID=1176131 RepID=A0A6G1H0F4_9PEZI|nr:alpha/beta-hydrolase [Aulographum hederae CBS 113979]